MATIQPPPAASPAPEEPPAARGALPLQGFRLDGPERPAGAAALRFDVDALPVADWGDPARGAGFTLRRTPDGWSLWVSTTLFAEVIVGAGGVTGPGGYARAGFTAFTGGSFGQGTVPDCGPGGFGKRLALWHGFAPAGWTDAGMNVEMEDGDFDLATCRATPKRSLQARAAAIVAGYVYGLRVREEDDAGRTSESLVVFLPRGALVSAGADPTMPLNASNTGPFTRLTFPLARGTAGSASVRLSPASLALWARLRRMAGPILSFDDPAAPHDDLLLGLDVAWQGDTRLGTLSLAPPPKPARAYAALLAALRK